MKKKSVLSIMFSNNVKLFLKISYCLIIAPPPRPGGGGACMNIGNFEGQEMAQHLHNKKLCMVHFQITNL